MNLLRFLSRPLLAAPFIVDGASALFAPESHVARARAITEPCQPVLEKFGIECTDEDLTLASRAMGATSLVAGLMLATGRAPRTSAAVLTALSVPVALVNNPLWTARTSNARSEMASGLFRGLALTGGLAIAMTDREGSPSAAWRVRKWKAERALAAQQIRAGHGLS